MNIQHQQLAPHYDMNITTTYVQPALSYCQLSLHRCATLIRYSRDSRV